jgi:DNA-binding NarL/FixJ family response regulator
MSGESFDKITERGIGQHNLEPSEQNKPDVDWGFIKSKFNELTAHQRLVMEFIAEGLPYTEIANKMGIAPGTVIQHALTLKNKFQLFKYGGKRTDIKFLITLIWHKFKSEPDSAAKI